jgi:hypothetical protein
MEAKLLTLTLSSVLVMHSAAALSAFTVDAGNDGFTGWTEGLTSGSASENGRFLGPSGTSMDTYGDSWGFYANSGATASSTYAFGDTLSVGDTVEISVSLGFIDDGGAVGFGLQNSSNVNRFESYYLAGDAADAFKITDLGIQENITGATTTYSSANWVNNSDFLTFLFTQGDSDTYTLSVDGVAITNTGLDLAASDISQIRLFNMSAGSGSDFNQYFNSLNVIPVPEPSVALTALLGLGWFARRKRSV